MQYLHKFSATWCQPCRVLTKTLAQVDLDTQGISLIEWDVDLLERDRLKELDIRGVPTLILMDESGVELSRQTGALTADDIRKWLGLEDDAIPCGTA